MVLDKVQVAGGHMRLSAGYCWDCGKKITDYKLYCRSYCGECEDKRIKTEEEERKLYVILRHREMFRKACNLLEKQSAHMYDYKEAIDAVKEFIEEQPDKFDSSYEVLAAIILIKNRIRCKLQYRIGRYQVDCLLPDYGVVLEIDGERHKQHKVRDSIRDKSIKEALGGGWEIVRIGTEYMDMKAERLPDAIEEVLEYRESKHVNWRRLQKTY